MKYPEKLKIGVFLSESSKKSDGGGPSYYDRLVNEINDFSFNDNLEIVFLSQSERSDKFKKPLKVYPILKLKNSLKVRVAYFGLMIFGFLRLKHSNFYSNLQKRIDQYIDHHLVKFFKENKIDLLYYLSAYGKTFNYPFIMTHWDLGHRTTYAFPELSMNGSHESRNEFGQNVLSKAFAIFVESERSREELHFYERICKDRIFVVPLSPSRIVEIEISDNKQFEILTNWNLSKGNYFFYPAQFWAHKNHFNLILAFSELLKEIPNLMLVLTGSDKGNLQYIKSIVHKLDIDKNVIFTGFVEEEVLYTFYCNAICLVMPTFLGPTNLPLIEAAYLNCPVLCSNLDGHKEQMGEDAIYFNPIDPNDIKVKLIAVYKNQITFNYSNYENRQNSICVHLEKHFIDLIAKRKCFD